MQLVDTLTFFQNVADICDGGLYNMALFEECGAVATGLSRTFRARAVAVWPNQLS